MAEYIMAFDAGTTSSRCIIFKFLYLPYILIFPRFMNDLYFLYDKTIS